MTKYNVDSFELVTPEVCLAENEFFDFNHPLVREFAARHGGGFDNDKARAVALYYAVRDEIRYNPYSIELSIDGMRASTTIEKGEGFCISKGVLLAAVLRAYDIPSRLGFADVKNHLASQRLLDQMGSELFVYHGYTDVYLDGKWVKATPAFNIELCEKFGVLPLEFDGENDSIFHAFDKGGRQHMEYVNDHGVFETLPLEEISRSFRDTYPTMADVWVTGSGEGDMGAEFEVENRVD
jgi:transglutaminase-like putative cysteine protease